MPEDSLKEETSVITENSKAEETNISQELCLCLPCISGQFLDLSES